MSLCRECGENAALPWSWFCRQCNDDWEAEVAQAEKSMRVHSIFEGELAVARLEKRRGNG